MESAIPVLLEGSTVYVLVEPADHTAMGKALALADAHEATQLHLIVDAQGGVNARRAAGIAMDITVWQISGTGLRPAQPAPVPEQGSPDVPLELVAEFHAAGLDVATEHGVVRGEVLGLEVSRIAGEPARIEVGVGVYDQEAFSVIHAEAPTSESLARVRDDVLRYRRAGADSHPFNRLVRERWLRALAVADPAAMGLDELAPIPSIVERGGLTEARPCSALGADAHGQVLVVFSAGMDLDLIPTAAELALHHSPDRISLVVAEQDRHPVNRRLAQMLEWPATFADAADL